MRHQLLRVLLFVSVALATALAPAEPQQGKRFDWVTVVNNNDLMPPHEARRFNSYNQPSVNVHGLVVFRARSRGGPPLGPPIHGIYSRDMSDPGSSIVMLLDKTTPIPHPNNLRTTFVETPAFPRIDMYSDAVATRGNHQPGWRYQLGDGSETRAGTTGIYANPFGDLLTAAAKLGNAPGLEFYAVPEFAGVQFEVFPGAPSISNGDTIVFKGNYAVNGLAKTGVYFRKLWNEPGGGTSPAIMVANNTDTLIPGSSTLFGSTAPPSAVGQHIVFAGFDNEETPTLGGIYMAPMEFQPQITELVGIGAQVPGEAAGTGLQALGEGIAFDGRHVAFWGSWGDETKTVRLNCPREGNKDRIAYCNQQLVCSASGETLGDPQSICDDGQGSEPGRRCYVDRQVPLNQGVFVLDSRKRTLRLVARTGGRFDDFLFWNYSGKTPCKGSGHSEEGAEEDGEAIRWRSSAFIAVSGAPGAASRTVFKARAGILQNGNWVEPTDGIYLVRSPGRSGVVTVLDTLTDGRVLDPAAPEGALVNELGLEREGLRGHWLTINATMGIDGGEEEDGIAGIYITRLR